MAQAVRIEWKSGPAALDGFDERWDALASRHPTPFGRSEWLVPWWRAFGDGRQPVVCRAWLGDELVGGLSLAASGRRLDAMSNAHTPVLAVLHADQAALDAVARSVVERTAGTVTLGPLALEGPEAAVFRAAGSKAGKLAMAEPTYVSPIVDIVGDFEAYRASMSGGWKTLERRARKSAREHDLVLRPIELPRGDVAFLEAGLAVEASGWKAEEGTAIVSQPDTAGFYREMAARFAQRGELALSGMWLDDQLVAFDLALLHGNRYWMLKTGYDEGFRRLTPGLVLRRAVIERCFEMGLATHELLGADTPWKRVFATSAREHCTWRVDRALPGPLAEHAWRRLRPHVRRAYHEIRERRSAS